MDKKLTKISKFMSLVLRHKPETISLVLNEAGWGSVEKLLRGCNITLQELEHIVENDNKKRYEFN
ncbi:MAG: RNA 2'-phosphotransferase, partial [Phenylobacterium sp.]